MSAAPPSDGALVAFRLFDASRERVWAAFSDPVALSTWWGPASFTNTFHEFVFRAGGAWKFTMHGPGGTAYAMDHRFEEVVAPERLVVRHIQPGHDFTLTVTLAPVEGGTAVLWRMLFDDPAEAARVRAFVLPANEQNLDRLQAHLAKTMSGAG
jgi:uncharacterized protein YndB with AHSA1/START domain